MKLTEEQIKKIKPVLTKLVNEVKQELKEATNFEMQLVTVIRQMAKDNRMTPKQIKAAIAQYINTVKV